MKNSKLYILFFIMLFSFNSSSFSQTKSPDKIESQNRVINTTDNSQSSAVLRDTELEENIRIQRLAGNKAETERLQNEMITRYNLIKDNNEIKIVDPVKANFFNEPKDNSTQTNLTFIDSSHIIFSHNTVSEQIGPNIGRIWNVAIIDGDWDSIKIHYSDDNGINWNYFATYLWYYPEYKFFPEVVDVELAINAYTNDKMLFILFDCRGYYTYNRLGLVRVDVGNYPGLCSEQLFNYGINNEDFYSSCITSDNATFTNTPYIHIASSGYSNDSYRPIKYAVIFHTFLINANIYYPNANIFITSGFYARKLDICAFTNQNIDYVMFADEYTASSEKNINVIQHTVYNALSGGTGSWIIIGNSTNKFSQVHLAADGSNVMITGRYEYNYQDHDIKYYASSSGISGFINSGFIDYSAMEELEPRVVSEWNAGGKFLCSYLKYNSYGYFASYFSRSDNNYWMPYLKMMSSDEMSNFGARYSIPVKTVNNECFVTFKAGTLSGNAQMLSAMGCSGNIVITKTLTLKLSIEGFYLKMYDHMTMADTIKVYLRNSSSPYSIIDSSKALVTKFGRAAANFANAQNGINYFISIKHRNSLETWSRPEAVQFTNNSFFYDFTSAQSQAYGNNQKQVDDSPTVFAIFSGDVSQDGFVDGSDASIVDNASYNFVNGYSITDVNGDNVTDGSDGAIVDNNAYNFVSKITP